MIQELVLFALREASGSALDLLVWSIAKVMDVSVRQLSKAHRPSCAPGALSRATDLTVLACPLNMHGLEGAAQVIAALLHGACTLRTGNTVPGTAQVEGSFDIGNLDVQAETAAFLKATEPHPLWEGPAPLCLAEHCDGKVRRLRLVLKAKVHFAAQVLKTSVSQATFTTSVRGLVKTASDLWKSISCAQRSQPSSSPPSPNVWP